MVRVNVIVEGETEEGFVKRVLAPYLSERNVYPTTRRVLLSRKGGRPHRGGIRSYHHPRFDIVTSLKEDVRVYCATMFDLYALPDDFPGMERAPSGPPHERVAHLERALAEDIGAALPDGAKRFIPYLQLHEFEALLFADVAKLDEAVSALLGRNRLDALRHILKECGSPENINEGLETAPSKRLKKLYPAYEKRLFGELVAEQTGIDTIRSACPHFDDCLRRLESLPPL
ncbi:MAG: DUF4276 family protein [Rhodothermales bacterium]